MLIFQGVFWFVQVFSWDGNSYFVVIVVYASMYLWLAPVRPWAFWHSFVPFRKELSFPWWWVGLMEIFWQTFCSWSTLRLHGSLRLLFGRICPIPNLCQHSKVQTIVTTCYSSSSSCWSFRWTFLHQIRVLLALHIPHLKKQEHRRSPTNLDTVVSSGLGSFGLGIGDEILMARNPGEHERASRLPLKAMHGWMICSFFLVLGVCLFLGGELLVCFRECILFLVMIL